MESSKPVFLMAIETYTLLDYFCNILGRNVSKMQTKDTLVLNEVRVTENCV